MRFFSIVLLVVSVGVCGGARVGIQWSTRVTRCWRDMQSGSLCGSMRSMGYCRPSSPYFEFVSRACCKTCQTFKPKPKPKVASTTRKPRRQSTKKAKGCTDTLWQCRDWAKQGHCGLTQKGQNKWMMTKCCASCRKRASGKPPKANVLSFAKRAVTSAPRRKSVSTSPCSDRNSSCGAWAKAGFCDQNSLVRRDCCHSCSVAPKVTAKGCVDVESRAKCSAWVKGGFCSKRATVRSLCRASCGRCRRAKSAPGARSKSASGRARTPRPRRTRAKAQPRSISKATQELRREELGKEGRRMANLRLATDGLATSATATERRDPCVDTTSRDWCIETAVANGYCESQDLVYRPGGGYCCATCRCFRLCQGDAACERQCRQPR